MCSLGIRHGPFNHGHHHHHISLLPFGSRLRVLSLKAESSVCLWRAMTERVNKSIQHRKLINSTWGENLGNVKLGEVESAFPNFVSGTHGHLLRPCHGDRTGLEMSRRCHVSQHRQQRLRVPGLLRARAPGSAWRWIHVATPK